MSGLPAGPVDPAWLSQVLDRTSIVDVVAGQLQLKRAGRLHKAPCPFHTEKTPSFVVDDKKGRYHCYGCGADGDAVQFLIAFGVPFRDAVARLARDAGMLEAAGPAGRGGGPAPRPPVRMARDALAIAREASRRRAFDLWRRAVPAAGTLVDTYLREARGLRLDVIGGMPARLRFIPDLEYWWDTGVPGARPACIHRGPAMVAAMTGVDGRFRAAHVTWLRPDGGGKLQGLVVAGEEQPAKKIRGLAWGAAVELVPCPGPVLGVAEGIESGLSVAIAGQPLPVWAAGSLGNIAGRGHPMATRVPHPHRPGQCLETPVPDLDAPGMVLPDGVDEVVILEDNDNADPLSASCLYERAAERWRAAGRTVLRARPESGKDFNDYVRAGV